MKSKSIILLIILLAFSTLSFGQKVYNKDYILKKETMKLALLPLLSNFNSFSDSIMVKIFDDGLSNIDLISPFETRELISSNFKAQEILDKITLKDYKKKELKTFPNLNTILEESEIKFLRVQFEDSDLMLIPVSLNFKSLAFHTFGSVNFRLYDLNSGEFIFNFSDNINVNIGGEDAIKGLTAALISLTHDYYLEKFIKGHKIE